MPNMTPLIESRTSWVSKVTKRLFSDTHSRGFLRAASWALIGAILSRGLNFASWVACARILGKTNFGALSMIQSTIGMFGVFAGMGLGLTATKYVAEHGRQNKERAGLILGLCFTSTLVCGAAISLMVALSAKVLAVQTLADPTLEKPLLIGSVLICFNAMNGYQTGALAGLEAFKMIAQVSFLTGITSFPLLIAGAYLGGLNGAVAALAASLICSYAINHWALRQECRRAGIQIRIRGCLAELPVLWHFSLPALLTSALVSPATWLCNMWLVHRPQGYAELGLYGAADRFRLSILFIPTSVFSTVVPMLSRLESDDNAEGASKVLRANLLVNVVVVSCPALAIALFAAPLMHIFGPTYARGWPVLVVLSLSTLPEALNTILGQPLITKAMWHRFGFDVILVGALVLLGRVFIPSLGALGLAIAYAVAFTLTSMALGFSLARSRRRIKEDL